jgi:hypothetical protein
MAIALACPRCAASVPVMADMVGKRARCPQCRMELALPTALAESPWDTGEGAGDPRDPRDAARSRPYGSILMWVAVLGGTCVALAVLCGGPVGLVYYMFQSEREAAELAAQVVVQAPGANLPAGAPPRAMRVTEFAGVFQVKDQLGKGDVVFKSGRGNNNPNRVCKEYVIELEVGRSYTIDLESPNFDAYLRLADLKGLPIQEDDDSGGGLNSRIVFTPPETTSYLVVATSLGGGFGSFALTVRESRMKKPR